jgi:hypothetical protein
MIVTKFLISMNFHPKDHGSMSEGQRVINYNINCNFFNFSIS